MSDFSSILGQSIDVLTVILFIIILLIFFYGQNYQGWWASRQIRAALRQLDLWRQYGIQLIKEEIEKFRPSTASNQDVLLFINEMLSFFVVSPSRLDPPIVPKLKFLLSRKEIRYQKLIRDFLPQIDEDSLATLTSLLQATSEIDRIYRTVRHNLIIGKKTRSSLFLQQTASEITQTMITAKAYRMALDSFIDNKPVGDSIGPLSVKHFIKEISETNPEYKEWDGNVISQEVEYRGRTCICFRAKGPVCRVGSMYQALKDYFSQIEEKTQLGSPQQTHRIPSLIITIDAKERLAGEKTGAVAQGIGVSIGRLYDESLEKFSIESLAYNRDPPIPVESVICMESLEEAVTPMKEELYRAIPKILRLIKYIIRTETQPQDTVLILGIGNALGVSP